MKERPILFSAEMVRAILAGRKTQTRRVVKSPVSTHCNILGISAEHEPMILHKDDWFKPCEWSPYGIPGDRLWVRETWAAPGNWDDIKPSKLIEYPGFNTDLIAYRATEKFGDAYFTWRPSIFMPRWASRILLEITDVRVERLQEITMQDAIAESAPTLKGCPDPRVYFKDLWDEINADRGFSWDVNPWVWVIKFKVLKG